MTRGTDFPVTFIRLPMKLRAMQWDGLNEKAIQDELAGAGFREIPDCNAGCLCGKPDQITAEVLNGFTDTWEGVEEGWWICIREDGKLFPVDPSVLAANYILE